MTRANPIRLLGMLIGLSSLPILAGCTDTLVFGAQREIDVAIVVNEDVAEPVTVNIGLNSQIAGLVPSIDSKQSDSTIPGKNKILPNDPEGEAASMFSGFYYTSETDLVPGKTFDYDAHIRSQFASGAAAVIIADSPEAVAEVVNVAEFHFDRGPSHLNPERLALVKDLKNKIRNNLKDDQVTQLYDNPPTTEAGIESLISQLKAEENMTTACDTTPTCKKRVTLIRVENVTSIENLRVWEQTINGML